MSNFFSACRYVCGPHSRSARFGVDRNALLLLRSEPQTAQPAAQSLYRLRYPGLLR
jgi:hypothetical protein